SLREKVVGQLDVEGQIETDGALAHIRAPVIDVRIVLHKLVQSDRGVLCCVDGGVFRQLQVYEQLGAVGRGKKLLRNEAHSIKRHPEQGESGDDRDLAGPHREYEEAAE